MRDFSEKYKICKAFYENGKVRLYALDSFECRKDSSYRCRGFKYADFRSVCCFGAEKITNALRDIKLLECVFKRSILLTENRLSLGKRGFVFYCFFGIKAVFGAVAGNLFDYYIQLILCRLLLAKHIVQFF